MTSPRVHPRRASAMATAAAIGLTAWSGSVAVADERISDVLDELVETLQEQQDGSLGAGLAGIRADCADGDDDACRMVATVGNVLRREAGETEFPELDEDEQR
jgi:hypothetical protein